MLQRSSCNQDIVSTNWLPLRFKNSTNLSCLFCFYNTERENCYRRQKARDCGFNLLGTLRIERQPVA